MLFKFNPYHIIKSEAMESINLQEFSEDAAYQVHAVLENISRLGERVDIYDGERLVGTILRGDPIPESEPQTDEGQAGGRRPAARRVPVGHEPGGVRHGGQSAMPPASFPPIEEALERHHQRLEQYEAEEPVPAGNRYRQAGNRPPIM